MAYHYADSVQHLVLAIKRLGVVQCNIISAHNPTTIRPLHTYCTQTDSLLKGSYEVYSGIEFPKHDFKFNYDANCRIYVVILRHSGLSYNMF